jgi:metal-responsive CopG/Arc/MetJ family transcriptional regulator
LQKLSGNSPAIQLVLPQPYIERLNALAQERRVTRSALIRAAIDTALFHGQGEQPGLDSDERASGGMEG